MHSLHHGILSLHLMIVYTCNRTVQFTVVANIINMDGAGYQHYRILVITLNVASTSQVCTSVMFATDSIRKLKNYEFKIDPQCHNICPTLYFCSRFETC